MSSNLVFMCDAPDCELSTSDPAVDQWLLLLGELTNFLGKDETGLSSKNTLSGEKHYCGLACLERALEFPVELVGRDASEEVGLPAE